MIDRTPIMAPSQPVERSLFPILTAKIRVPHPRPTFISRPRLLTRLDTGLNSALTLLSAPAGCGKTTLLVDWLRHTQCPVAWLALDATDNDPYSWLRYLIAALQSMIPGVGNTVLALLHLPKPPSYETLIATLLNDLAALEAESMLVLDDYHLVHSSVVHQAVTFMVQHMPAPLHLVIATREDPPLPLVQLRAQGILNELRADELRFRPDEAALFLRDVMGLTLTPDDVATLEARTEGWIAGLQLAALSLQGQPDVAERLLAFTGNGHALADYLVQEVLQQQSTVIQQFLLHTAILDRMCGSLCAAVLDQEPGVSQQVLEELEHANLFVFALDDQRQWYCYHHLFLDVLRRLLQQTSAEDLSRLHRRAAVWYHRHNLMIEAINHALAASDFTFAAGLIEASAEMLLMQSQIVTLLTWLTALPPDIVQAHPRLSLLLACVFLFTGRIEAVEPFLNHVEQTLHHHPHTMDATQQNRLQGEVAALRAFMLLLQCDATQAIKLARQAVHNLPTSSFLQRITIWTLGTAYMSEGDLRAASQTFAQVVASSQASHNSMMTLIALSQLAEVHIWQGQLRQAETLYRQALQVARNHSGVPLPASSMAYIGLSVILREWNDLPGALEMLQKGLALCRQWGEQGLFDAYASLARVHQARHDWDAAFDALQHMKELVYRLTLPVQSLALVSAYEIRFWLAHGELTAARQVAEQMISEEEIAIKQLREIVQLTRIRLRLALMQNEPPGTTLDPILAELHALRRAASTAERISSVVECYILEALAFSCQQNRDAALAALEQALTLAQPEGYIRLFVDEDAPMAHLLDAYHPTEVKLVEYRNTLLNAFPASHLLSATSSPGGLPPVDPVSPDTDTLIEVLSEREFEVLCLIADGLSNREIAERLVVSMGTIKTHVRNIYGKLGVNSRTRAVARARKLRLL